MGLKQIKDCRKQYISVVYGASRSLSCFAAFRRPYGMLCSRRDAYGSEFSPINQSYFLNRSMRWTHKRFECFGLYHFYVVFIQSILQSSQRDTSRGSKRHFSNPLHVRSVPCPIEKLMAWLLSSLMLSIAFTTTLSTWGRVAVFDNMSHFTTSDVYTDVICKAW